MKLKAIFYVDIIRYYKRNIQKIGKFRNLCRIKNQSWRWLCVFCWKIKARAQDVWFW